MDKLMSWLCCMKWRGNSAENMEGKMETTVPIDTGQGGYKPTVSEPQLGEGLPWVRKYFQAALYHIKPMEGLTEGDDGDVLDSQKSSSMEHLGKAAAMNRFGCSQRRSSSLDNLKKKVRLQLPNEAEMDQLDAARGQMNSGNQDAPFRNTRSFGGMLDK